MLDIITLKVIRNIFDIECLKKISAQTKMCYISSLIWHFEDKEPSHANLKGFSIPIIKIKKYSSFLNNYQQMQEAGLVIISEKEITFIDVWSKHIDKKRLEKVSPEEFVAMIELIPIEQIENEIRNNSGIFDLLGMKHSLTKLQVKKLMDAFIKEQQTLKKMYSGSHEAIKHFIFWAGINHSKLKLDSGIGRNSGKILGLD